MSSSISRNHEPAVLIFGSLTRSFSQSNLSALRTTILSSPQHAWVKDVISSLPAHYKTLTAEIPDLHDVASKTQIDNIAKWLNTADLSLDTKQLSNSLLAPLVVIEQLVQYSAFLDGQQAEHQKPVVKETAGFCIGLLSAFAVARTYQSTATDFDQNAGVAAYISVAYDITRMSVTTTVSTLEPLQKALRDAGFSTTELGLSGRFHSEYDHRGSFDSIMDFCDKHPAFAFSSSTPKIPTRAKAGEALLNSQESHHKLALQAILLHKCEWYNIISDLKASYPPKSACFVSFGERCIPSSVSSSFAGRTTYFDNATALSRRVNTDDVAVVGMSINVAGASSLPEFWNLLAAGRSQHRRVSEDKFSFDTVFRENDAAKNWYGNFIDGVEDFDHKFFKKTPRESSSMDPQQRLLLQCAYQAVEMSGYFNDTNKADAGSGASAADLKNIGCYIGMCGNDYVANCSHHAPTAYTATGTLRSFVAGKLSHYFGWLGPSLTLDTACSASAVAIHTACRAILSGEVVAALAGGTNTISEPGVYQNLAGASFLSPTGACKPFDANADGYCRGEAVTAVFLKSLSKAREDGDVIFGVISGTAVAQNSNDTPIVVPNAPSLSTLFRSVLQTAKLDAQDVSVVEAHGTGTPVGDPAEYAAIRHIFGQEKGNRIERPVALELGSVKGLVGHTEGSSGAVSLIKVLCMMHEAAIPPQASHSVLNPAIGANANDGIKISTELKPWNAEFKAALINNYGASGSNASMVVTQAPKLSPEAAATVKRGKEDSDIRYPFWFAGLDDRSIRSFTTKLRDQLNRKPNAPIQDLAFNISRQSNRSLPRALLLSARSVPDLFGKLAELDKVATSFTDVSSSKPVILCFGGQMSTTINLDRVLYNRITLLRQHMDRCNDLAIALGAGSIYPAVFQDTPISDIVLLQAALFALQYSTAQCWIECGVRPVAVVGHSFGELTAMCLSGVIGLEDAMKMIIRRATVVRESWGPEKGSMLVIDADEDDVLKVLADVDQVHDASIACYNTPQCYTVAGSVHSVDLIQATVSEKYPHLRVKRLSVSNAFHSGLVDSLRPKLQQIGKDLTFNQPTLHFERSSNSSMYMKPFDADVVADHLRQPVYFSHAVRRLAKRYPSAVWLEAGSNATITSMATKSLAKPSDHHLQAVNLSGSQGLQRLIDSTMALWKAGVNVTYWGHSRAQTEDYDSILLPPYQFERNRHWLELKAPPKVTTIVNEKMEEILLELYTFTGYQDTQQRSARFRINTMLPKYHDIVAGHVIAGVAPICPATVQIDIAIEALRSLFGHLAGDEVQPQIRSMTNLVPICVDASRSVWLEAEALDVERTSWSWKWTSTSPTSAVPTTHVSGEIHFRKSVDIHYQAEFARYERLVSHRRCIKLLQSENPDDVLQGQRSIYRVFSPIVQYSPLYFGLQKLVGRGSESAGRVIKKHTGKTWLDAFLSDAFCQVAGIWVNCMAEESEKDMWIANGIEQWIRAPTMTKPQTCSIDKWDIFGQHSRSADGTTTLSDVFVFDAGTGRLVEAILGIQYAKVSRLSMGKLLSRLSRDIDGPVQPVVKGGPPVLSASIPLPDLAPPKTVYAAETIRAPKSTQEDVFKRLKAILAELSGLDVDEIKDNVELGDIGVDSLMGMEMAKEIENEFSCTLPQDELAHVTDLPDLLRCVQGALGTTIIGPDISSAPTSSDDNDTDTVDSITPMSVPDEAEAFPFDLVLSQDAVVKAFSESKLQTDKLMEQYGIHGYLQTVAPHQDEMCVALIVEAFRNLGCDLGAAKPGQELSFITHAGDQKKFAQYLYTVLEKARVVQHNNGGITRTDVPVPSKTSSDLFRGLLDNFPEHACCNELAYYTGSRLSDIITGQEDGIKLIFGTERGRELVGAVYADFPMNKMYYDQMGDFLRRLASSHLQSREQGPLKILEMGAGTGATTRTLIPLLANLGIMVEYTFTDLASSFVAAARKKFKQYPFMKFRVHDIEKEPAKDLLHSQHVVIASNAVHATRSLPLSTTNIRKMLRPDGLLLLLEMTEPMYWCDIIFGVFEGWWMFEDDRQHAVTSPQAWEKVLHSVGYGHVDWSDGSAEEINCERLIIATAGGTQAERLLPPSKHGKSEDFRHVERRASTERAIRGNTADFALPPRLDSVSHDARRSGQCVLITGATGSLGTHMVAHYANLTAISSIICLNRRNRSSGLDPLARQLIALTSRDIILSPQATNKVSVFEVDITKPHFGLPPHTYDSLVNTVTHIVHNAWPMNAKQPFSAFTPQFRVLRNLIDFAALISSKRPSNFEVGFQFISSIATVGHYPLHEGSSAVPEQRMTIEHVLPNGYGDAKYVCERMLDATLHQHHSRFKVTVVRLGQVAGSSTSGYWNETEHLPFLLKSSQTLGALPRFEGPVSWTPVDAVARVCADLALGEMTQGGFYHIDNPVRQPWSDLLPLLAQELEIPEIISFGEWIRRVRSFPSSGTTGQVDLNPANRLVDFLETDFLRMSCGGVLLETERSRNDSEGMRNIGPVDDDTVRRFIQSWRKRKFLV
ncbi:uncharacterized protein EKO05_0007950 [Ascochyta rabiei]|uniref:uncharacterized protein n=1 Tax=Didymella rabiei TaxID=5454 RepID=UPI001900F41B|nr:uncharacterized protein EKO05_0007950 [Ascochyta rabiei]UPX17606.1 hypothetical protein EKO05_0007950 [Ascochyta rabiei]